MAVDHNEEMSTLDNSHARSETRLPDWALMVARGKDARAFLHGQLTQDMDHLLPGEVRLAGYCSDPPAGMVVLCAPAVSASLGIQSTPPHTHWALVEVKWSAIQSQSTLHGGSLDGPLLTLKALPYPVPSPEVDA